MINQFQNNKTIFETKPVGLGFENTEIQRFDSFASFKICFNGKLLVSFLQFFPKGKAHLSNTTARFILVLLLCMPHLRMFCSKQRLSLMLLLLASGECHLAEGVAVGC